MGQILNLHVLRALTTMVVVLAHALMLVNRWAGFSDATLIAFELLGRMAVDTFFVISGFIMIHTSTGLFGRGTGALEFARRRLIRIVPLYWLATATEASLRSIHHRGPTLSELLHSLLFVPQVVQPGQPLRPIVGVGWTLNYEVFFYILFGLALLLRRERGVAVLLSALVAIVAWGATEKPLTDTSLPTSAAAFLTDRIILMFGVGVAIGFLCDRRGGSTPERVRHPLVLSAWMTVITIVTVQHGGQSAYPSLSLDVVLRLSVIGGFLIFLFGSKVRAGRMVVILIVIGDASYSIYLFHFLFLVGFEKIWLWSCGAHAATLCVLSISMLALTGGGVLHYVVEKPITRRLGRLTATRPDRRGVTVEVKTQQRNTSLMTSIPNGGTSS